MKKDFAYAVKAIVMKDNTFLVLHRSKEEIESSFMNKHEAWDLPGGGVHFFETGEKALFREVKEETGIKIKLIKLLDAYDAVKSQLHLVLLTYICEYISGDVELSNEHDRFFWLSIGEMEEMGLPQWMIRSFKKATAEYEISKIIEANYEL